MRVSEASSMQIVAAILGTLIGLFLFVAVISFTINGMNFAELKFWGPKEQAVEREIYEESPSRVHGMERRLGNYMMEYREYQAEGDDEGAQRIRQLVLHRYGGYDRNKLSDHLVEFLEEMEEVQ